MTTQHHQITAIIYDRKGRVLSVGQNSFVKTHPMQAKYAAAVGEPHKVFLHAEVAAIVKCRDLSRAHRIFVARYNRNGEPRLAKPCKLCAGAIGAAGIQLIEHT